MINFKTYLLVPMLLVSLTANAENTKISHHTLEKKNGMNALVKEVEISDALYKSLHKDDIVYLKGQIALYKDFPKQGILFEDFTPILANEKAFQKCVNLFYERYKSKNIEAVAGLESRGFILGAALAYKLGVSFIPIRKPGKTPGPTYSVNYQKEYGSDTLVISQSAVKPNQRVLIIDDLIATGGSALAAIELINLADAHPVEFASLLEVKGLNGREKLGISSFNLLD